MICERNGLKIDRRRHEMETKGKVLLVGNDFEIHSKGYNLFKQTEKIGFINDKKYALLSQFKFTRRFLSADIT